MAEWKSANLGNLLPSAVTDAITDASDAFAVLSPILGTIRDGLDLAKTFLIGLPVADIGSALAQALEDFFNDFRAAGVYYLPVIDFGLEDLVAFNLNFEETTPDGLFLPAGATFQPNITTYDKDRLRKAFKQYFGNRYLLGPETNALERFKARIISSFTDIGDDQRPQFTGDVAGVVVLVGAPSLAEFIDVAVQLVDLWPNNRELARWENRLREVFRKGMPSTLDQGRSVVTQELDGDNGSGYTLNYGRSIEPGSIEVRQLSLLEERTDQVRDFLGIDTFSRLAVDDLNGGFRRRGGWFVNGGTIDYEAGTISGLSFDIFDPGRLVVQFTPDFEFSSPPDWTTLNLDKLFPFVFEAMENYLLPIVQALRAGANSQDAMVALIDGLDDKLSRLQELIDESQRIVSLLNVMLGATGIYTVYVSSASGIDGWVTEFQNALNEPPFDQFDAFVGGTVFLAGGPSLAPFDNFFSALA